jgi:glycine/serine hydroxymethyltransferase
MTTLLRLIFTLAFCWVAFPQSDIPCTAGTPIQRQSRTKRVADERIDYDEVERLAREHRPKMIIAGASAYPRIIDFARFRQIAKCRGRNLPRGHGAHLGLVAAGIHRAEIATDIRSQAIQLRSPEGSREGVLTLGFGFTRGCLAQTAKV